MLERAILLASTCRSARISFIEFQAANFRLPSRILIFSRFCEPVASLPAKQGNNTKQKKSQLLEVSGISSFIQV